MRQINSLRTLPIQVFSLVAGRYTVEWHHVMAATLLATVPVAAFFIWLQRTLSAVWRLAQSIGVQMSNRQVSGASHAPLFPAMRAGGFLAREPQARPTGESRLMLDGTFETETAAYAPVK